MPHILVSAYDENKVIKQMNIHLEVQFSKEYYYNIRCHQRLKELENKVNALISEYFDKYESEQYTNHQYNTRMNNY